MSDQGRTILLQAAELVAVAYTAFGQVQDDGTGYQNGTVSPKTQQTAIAAIQKLNPLLSNIQPIWVYEYMLGDKSQNGTDAAQMHALGHASNLGPREEFGLKSTSSYRTGFQLFGFAATYNSTSGKPINVVSLRGTATLAEAAVDILGWGDNVQCMMPSDGQNQQSWGMVKRRTLEFYQNATLIGGHDSMATSLKNAVSAVNSKSGVSNWVFLSHSLGAAVLTLAMADCYQSKMITPNNTIMVSWGGLVTGVQSFVDKFNKVFPGPTIRVVNLCDFVPSIQSITPAEPNPPYVHVGSAMVFVWDTGSNWGNHSLQNIYIPMFETAQNYSCFTGMDVTYPVGIVEPKGSGPSRRTPAELMERISSMPAMQVFSNDQPQIPKPNARKIPGPMRNGRQQAV
jgi:hypothetical protein